ncbi:MAG: ABC transporter permease subunit [Acaryochloridaceae cyanobacterium CSU_3_4]|nr:ABC transporter permease subunit [Acaryochloridaceae cyanobacterium CSU_3_4]
MPKNRKGRGWRQPWVRAWIVQGLVLLLLGVAIAYFGANLVQNLQRLQLPFGFDFLWSRSGPSIGETLIEYSPTDNIVRAFGVGLLNTLRVVILGMVLATFVGILVGMARLSENWLVRKLATIYVETLRNFPLLLQLLFWYLAIFLKLPTFAKRIQLPGPIYLSKNGVALPWFQTHSSTVIWMVALGLGGAIAFFLWRFLRRQQIEQGTSTLSGLWPLLLLISLVVLVGIFVGVRLLT